MDDPIKNAETAFDKELDNDRFWNACDYQLIMAHGNEAKYWLGMLEDPDPEDLIFEYQRIVRRTAYVEGYVKGVLDQASERTKDAD